MHAVAACKDACVQPLGSAMCCLHPALLTTGKPSRCRCGPFCNTGGGWSAIGVWVELSTLPVPAVAAAAAARPLSEGALLNSCCYCCCCCCSRTHAGCSGYFLPEVKAGVNCTECPTAGCADCEDFSGKCRKCRPGMGLVDGECRPCRNENCKSCDGECRPLWNMDVALLHAVRVRSQLALIRAAVAELSSSAAAGDLGLCTECRQPKPLLWEGYFLDAAGNCTQACALPLRPPCCIAPCAARLLGRGRACELRPNSVPLTHPPARLLRSVLPAAANAT